MQSVEILAAGTWNSSTATEHFIATWKDRFLRRGPLQLASGKRVLLELEKTIFLHDGDALKLKNDMIIGVRSQPEYLRRITTSTPDGQQGIVAYLQKQKRPFLISPTGMIVRAVDISEPQLAIFNASSEEIVAPFNVPALPEHYAA
ncbi:MAG: hypothetical protein LKH33_06560 [Acetobacter sp.]|jgi:urease accessory protein UreE|nr:hypothetical protein [Acetobacter sp.]MCH4060439.1 hypothetical protein [Acetobacter sp.]MCH4087379.1 hypothetical protein [Acetobacter sp.]MCI1293898.1 hypothetical protein [Acetobacter sp.]MCI1320508.1 hypothetical protein [Acetobacter sp.]